MSKKNVKLSPVYLPLVQHDNGYALAGVTRNLKMRVGQWVQRTSTSPRGRFLRYDEDYGMVVSPVRSGETMEQQTQRFVKALEIQREMGLIPPRS